MRVDSVDVDKSLIPEWFVSSGFKSERKRFIIAAQDNCLHKKNYQGKILK